MTGRPLSLPRPLFSPFAAALALTAFAALSPAAAQDAPGSKDHPLVGRYEGSKIIAYQAVDFDEQRFVNAPVDLRADGEKFTDGNSVATEGKVTRIRYDAPKDRSSLEILKNYEDSLTSKGFAVVYSCANQSCIKGVGSPWRMSTFAGDGLINNRYGDGVRYLLAKAERPTGNVYAGVFVGDNRGAGPLVRVIVAEEKPIETGRIAFIDADAMSKAISAEGRVALYGILFDFDKADIKPESRATLDEIVKFLKANAALSVVVAGHTDAEGGFDYNLDLSRRRAAAVVEDLKRQGIGAARLTPFGAGMAAPIASNDEEAGRTKNRRVELVKR